MSQENDNISDNISLENDKEENNKKETDEKPNGDGDEDGQPEDGEAPQDSVSPDDTETAGESSYQISRRSLIGVGAAALAVIIIVGLFLTDPIGGSGGDKLATVNGESITEDDLTTSGMNQSQALRQSIITTVLSQKAESEGIMVSESEAESQLKQRLQSRNQTLSGLKESLEQRGVSYEERRVSYQRQLATQRYIDSQIDQDQIQATESELRQLYNQSLRRFPDGQAPGYNEVRPQLAQRVEQQKRQQASAQIIRSLVQNASITTTDGVEFALPPST
jgi:hypothetical protein